MPATIPVALTRTAAPDRTPADAGIFAETMEIVNKAVHLSGAVLFTYSLYYYYTYVNIPARLNPLDEAIGGKFKYLTFCNLVSMKYGQFTGTCTVGVPRVVRINLAPHTRVEITFRLPEKSRIYRSSVVVVSKTFRFKRVLLCKHSDQKSCPNQKTTRELLVSHRN